jgi:glyoxylase-like metal-dependent hydrolase (beta-lactamase superfamily II)
MVSEVRGRETVLTGWLEDPSALYGVLAQIEALRLELLELRQIRRGRNRRNQVMTAHQTARDAQAVDAMRTSAGTRSASRLEEEESVSTPETPIVNTRTSGADDLPDYAPVPRSALGPALNDQGYYVGPVERNLYWVTDGTYQAAFLTTSDGVVLFDAPPTIGHNLQRSVDEIAAANGVSNKVNYLVYSHHHADHVGAASLFDKKATRIGHEETRRLLLRDDDPARPPNEETFQDRRTLEIGGERIDLAWHGPNHSPDNIIIHLPDHDALMLIDIVNPGWAPIYLSNLTEDIPGYIEAPANALAYSWKHFIGGHNGRLGMRDDITLHQQYMADISESSRQAINSVDPTPYFQKYGENAWAAVKGYLDEIAATAAAPVIEKYTGVIAAADVFTESTTFQVMQSIRLDLGHGSYVHP